MGGEYQPDAILKPNAPINSRRDAQIFSRPYLSLREARPEILHAPDAVTYGEVFQITANGPVGRVSFVGLSSVTHSYNRGQRIFFAPHNPVANGVRIIAPPNANICPPGYYLLFLLTPKGSRSVARFIQLKGQPAPPNRVSVAIQDPAEHVFEMAARATRPPVEVGLKSVCPYGLGACWAGAYGGLKQLDGVESVMPVADARHSTATVYLDGDRIPDLAAWQAQFWSFTNGGYKWRGVETTLTGTLAAAADGLHLELDSGAGELLLRPLLKADKVQLDRSASLDAELSDTEAQAYENLKMALSDGHSPQVTVTGPILQLGGQQIQQVRLYVLGGP